MDDPFERAVEREREERRARRHRVARAGFKWHATAYVAVNAGLLFIWAAISFQQDGGTHPWFVYPLVGWGIGLAVHYVAARPALHSHRSRRGPAGDDRAGTA
jgi:apolipoprotein N-acyltransferase